MRAIELEPNFLGASLNSSSNPGRALGALLDLAEQTGLPVDVHLDEHLEPHNMLSSAVTDAVIARSAAFRFAKPFSGLEIVPRRGDLIAWDGDEPVRAPYDNCVLVMPVPNNIKTGLTAVRLGRVEAR